MEQILKSVSHRPFEIPEGRWQYYQEWNDVIFMHWLVPYEILHPLVPNLITLDSFNNQYWVSLVAFTMQKIRPRYLPSFKPITDFHEINLRTYVKMDNKAGVYFLNIEAEKLLSAFIARQLSDLPYEKSLIKREKQKYNSINHLKNYHLKTEFTIKDTLTNKSELELWLTERYCLYLDSHNQIYRYDIHHEEWVVKNIELKNLDLSYTIQNLSLSNTPDLSYYSDGVKVIAWNRQKI